MKYLDSNKKNISVEMPLDEFRTLLGIVNEFRNGPYAISDDEWDEVMIQPRSLEKKLLQDFDKVFDAFEDKYPDEKIELSGN